MSTQEEILEVLNCGIHIVVSKYHKALFNGTEEEVNYWASALLCFPERLVKVAWSMIRSKNQKQYRLVKRLKLMDSDAYCANNKNLQIVFLTLTFKDLNTTTKESRRKYVRRYLKNHCLDFVANIDYGAKNGREHYHAVALINGPIDYTKWHKYGAIKGELVPTRFKEEEKRTNRIAYYITKLSLHALKDGTYCLDRLVYCRKNEDYYTAILPF